MNCSAKSAGVGRVENLNVVVVGASGDLARKKIFPALFSLFCQGYLPERFSVFGFARSKLSESEFRERIFKHLTCRYTPEHSCAEQMDKFLARCHYVSGDYGSSDSFLNFYEQMQKLGGGRVANRMFYLAIPPSIFVATARAIGSAGMACKPDDGSWSRVVLEKPFGHDRQSSDELSREMSQVFSEKQTFRIDHYLGKEVVQNMIVLRFANLIFEPLWNRNFIRCVEIIWKEKRGIEGRGGYFDQYGIVRDLLQNHLLQMLALIAMEPPERLESRAISTEKAKLLRCIRPVTMEDIVVGQYTASTRGQHTFPGYVDDPTVADDSITPTFAAVRLEINNWRWADVPFMVSAGKGLEEQVAEIRIHFRDVPGNVFHGKSGCPQANQMVIRVQPDAAIYLSLTTKVPGMGMKLAPRPLDLQYKSAFTEQIPEAYESLLLDVIRGDSSLFIRSDELRAAWDVFTPVLHEMDRRHLVPEPYEFGSTGPDGTEKLGHETHNIPKR